ncbi:MAG: hypothetical protein Q8N77_04380 [Nanoarchaeota archaeon]|nr:hypothetical protein [Nanoarchaeota archaeon]
MTQDYPCSTLEEKINSTDVSIIGVAHVKEFFKRHENFFYDKISCSDAIMLEQPVGGEFYDSKFFGELGMIAHKQKKRVYQADPVNTPSFCTDFMQGGLGFILISSFDVQAALGLYLFLGSIPGSGIRYWLTTEKNDATGDFTKIKNGYEFLMYGDTDYRNLMIAHGIEKICTETKNIKKLA